MAKCDIETYYEDGKWKNRPQGNDRATSTHNTKAEAQAAGRDMARDRRVEHVVKKDAPSARETRTRGRVTRGAVRADVAHIPTCTAEE